MHPYFPEENKQAITLDPRGVDNQQRHLDFSIDVESDSVVSSDTPRQLITLNHHSWDSYVLRNQLERQSIKDFEEKPQPLNQ